MDDSSGAGLQSSGNAWNVLREHLVRQHINQPSPQQVQRAFARARTAALRGGAAGLGIRGGLHLLAAALRVLRPRKTKGRQLSWQDALADTLTYTAFLALMGGSYVCVDEALALLFGRDKTSQWRALIAGAVAGHALLITGSKTRHHSLATYVLLRGITLLVRCGNKPLVQDPPAPGPPPSPAYAPLADLQEHAPHPDAGPHPQRHTQPPLLPHEQPCSSAPASQEPNRLLPPPQPDDPGQPALPRVQTRRPPRPATPSGFAAAGLQQHASSASLQGGSLQADVGPWLGSPHCVGSAALGAAPHLGGARCPGRLRRTVHWLLTPTRWQHGDVVLMCAASAQIVYSFIMQPSSLPRSYIAFISRQASKEPLVWAAVREQALRNWRGTTDGPLKVLQGTPWQHCRGATPCEFWHPGQPCLEHTLSNVPPSYARALAVYLPVYLVPAILVHRQKLVAQPQLLLPKLALGVCRSALFLTAFIALAFGAVCGGFAVTGVSTGPIIAACTAAGGLAVLVEKKSRRMELALYCVSRAAESYCRCLLEWGVIPERWVPARLDVLLFAAGCACIMHCYSDENGEHRDVFRSKYLNVLDFVFGNSGVQQGTITHLPSNKDLLQAMSTRLRQSMSQQRLSSTPSPPPDGLHPAPAAQKLGPVQRQDSAECDSTGMLQVNGVRSGHGGDVA